MPENQSNCPTPQASRSSELLAAVAAQAAYRKRMLTEAFDQCTGPITRAQLEHRIMAMFDLIVVLENAIAECEAANKETTVQVEGKPVTVGFNAFVPR